MSVPQVTNPESGQPGRVACRVPHLTPERVGRDVPVGFPGSGDARIVLAGCSPGGAVAGLSVAAMFAPASGGVVGRQGAVPVPAPFSLGSVIPGDWVAAGRCLAAGRSGAR